MKRILSAALILATVLVLTACGIDTANCQLITDVTVYNVQHHSKSSNTLDIKTSTGREYHLRDVSGYKASDDAAEAIKYAHQLDVSEPLYDVIIEPVKGNLMAMAPAKNRNK